MDEDAISTPQKYVLTMISRDLYPEAGTGNL